MKPSKMILAVIILQILIASAVIGYITYAASTTYRVQSDNTVSVKVLPTPTPTPTPTVAPLMAPTPSPELLIAHLTISSTEITYGEDIKITATLDKPIAGINMSLHWVDSSQPTFNSEDESLYQECNHYLSSSQCQTTAVTDEKGIAVFDLGTGLPVNNEAFGYGWHFNIMPQESTVG